MRVEEIAELLPKGKLADINRLVKEGLAEDVPAITLLNDGLLKGMDILANNWAAGKAFIPEVLIGARCLNSAIEILDPILTAEKAESKGLIVIGTVKSDLHDIGKNLCSLMMRAKGFKIVDLGVDVESVKFVEAVRELKPDVLCLSALLTTSMQYFREIIDGLQDAGLRDQVLVAIGGAPVTQAFANEVGADLYTPDAVALSNTLISMI